MVNDLLPPPAQPAEIAGSFLPCNDDQKPFGSRQNFDIIEIVEFFDLARFLQC